MKHIVGIMGSVFTLLLICAILAACGSESSSSGGAVNGEAEARGAEAACEEYGGAIAVADEEQGYLNYVVCKDGTIKSWESWYSE